MKRKLTLFILFVATLQLGFATDRHVYSGQSIQSAIDASVSGDRVLIHAGTYSESISVLNKSNLIITDAGDGTVIVQGDGTTDAAIYVENPTNITVSNLTVKNIRKQTWVKGIYVYGAGSGVQLLNNVITDVSYKSGAWNDLDDPGPDYELNANPLVVVGSSTSTALSNVLVSGNEISYCMTGWSESLTIKGNIDGFTVENNTVHHVTNIAIDAYGLGDWPNAAQARNGVIQNNTVYNAVCHYSDNGGIYVDGGKDILIANNTVYNSVYGITIGCENQGQVPGGTTSGIIVVNNLIYNNAKSAIMIGTSGDDDGLQGDVVNTLVTGNTFLKNSTADQWGGEIVLQNCSGIEFYNNVVYGLHQQMIGEGDGKGSCTFGYNIFYNPVGSPLIGQAINDWNTINFSTWKAQNNDNSSIYTDPLLVSSSPTSPDVHLQSGSPGINAGMPNFTPVTGEVDIDRQARILHSRVDIGVDESGVSVTGVNVSPSSASIAVGDTAQLTGTVVPSNAANQQVTWSSDNTSVAIVSASGLVTGVSAGSATITATTQDGSFTDDVDITVTSGGGSGTGIIIDGNLSDWSGVTAIATESGQSSLSLKVFDDGTYLYFGISGSGLGTNYQIYLNTDNNPSTGLDHWSFPTSSGADYYIENGVVEVYTGDGSTWSWSTVGAATASKNGNVCEVRVAKSLLGILNNQITVGYADINSSWSVVSTLGFASYTQIAPASADITIDGSLSDWSNIAAIATESGQSSLSLKIYDDGTYLYFGISGSGLGANYQIYLNTDNNPSTGLNHWSFSTSSGADYYIENGVVEAYTGDGSTWSWSTVGAATASKSGSVCEVRVAKTLLGSLSDPITVGYADINSSWSVVSTLGFTSFSSQSGSRMHGEGMVSATSESQIAVYPNPVHDYLTIHLGSQSGTSKISIYNPGGQLVFDRITSESVLKISRSEIKTKGVLLLNIVSGGVQKDFKVIFR